MEDLVYEMVKDFTQHQKADSNVRFLYKLTQTTSMQQYANGQLFNALKDKGIRSIYLLTMSNRHDRNRGGMGMLQEICLDEYTNIVYATPFPHNDVIIKAFNDSGRGRFTKPGEYDCARNHYGIIRQCYDAGATAVLIIEDDVRFLKDTNRVCEFIKKLPEDFDVVQLGGFTVDERVCKYMDKGKTEWVKHDDVGLWNNSAYILSRRGMEYYLAFMDKIFWVADGPLYKAPLNKNIVNAYMPTIPIVIQADKDVVSSDIRNKDNDSIDYNTENMFEKGIDRNDYIEYKTN